MLTLPVSAERLIPHRHPMAFADTLTAAGDHYQTEYRVPTASPYAEEDGTLLPEALLELIAQCFAAGAGYQTYGSQHAGWGYLASVRSFYIHGSAHTGDLLTATCQLLTSVGPIHVIEGNVCHDQTLLASAQLKIYIPDNV